MLSGKSISISCRHTDRRLCSKLLDMTIWWAYGIAKLMSMIHSRRISWTRSSFPLSHPPAERTQLIAHSCTTPKLDMPDTSSHPTFNWVRLTAWQRAHPTQNFPFLRSTLEIDMVSEISLGTLWRLLSNTSRLTKPEQENISSTLSGSIPRMENSSNMVSGRFKTTGS